MSQLDEIYQTPERAQLCFAEEVEQAFGFLISRRGFQLVESLPTYVRYQREDLFLAVYHGRISYEINVEVGRPEASGSAETFRLFDVLGALAGWENPAETLFSASQPTAVRNCVRRIAGLVSDNYGPLFVGGLRVLEKVARFVEGHADGLSKERDLAEMRAKAQRAWKDRDFASVQALYDAIEPNARTVLETKRLDYARNH
jgi:hypothetical protein